MSTSFGLQTKGLSTGYRDRKRGERIISKDLNVSIAPGELVMFMGPNGSGKSTLMHTIAGLLPPISGEVLIGEESVAKQSIGQIAKMLSLVLTERITSATMTVEDVVSIGRYPHIGYLGKLSEYDHKLVAEAIELCNLRGMEQRTLSELSDGERQRTMIARALAQQTPLILLDEPTAHLDLPSRLDVILMLRRLAHDMKRSILVSTHELDLALSWADTIWLLDREGRLTTGAPEDLVLAGSVEKTFGNEWLGYDSEAGEFVTRLAKSKVIHLEAEGLPYIWTKRALGRIGYDLATDKQPATLSVQVKDGVWHLTQGSVHHTASCIKDLVTLINTIT